MRLRKLILYSVTVTALTAVLASCGERACTDRAETVGVPEVTGDFTVEFLKVGQADSMILKTQNKCVIIDCGEKDDGDKIIKALEEMNIDKIDYLFITHFDKDHVGGAPELFDYTVPDKIIEADYTGDGKSYSSYIEYADNNLISDRRIQLKEKMSITIDDVLLTAYPAEKREYSDGNDNNHSIVITAKHGDNTFLFAGDSQEERLKELEGQIGSLRCNLVKMPHHGRYCDYTGQFLKSAAPEYAVITSSKKNPAEDKTLEALKNINCKVYQTFEGNVWAVSNGTSIDIQIK